MKDSMLKQMYAYDPEKRAYAIEISLDDYGDIYNEWDRAQLRHKDINQELRAFLEECSTDIPMRHPIFLKFFLPRGFQDKEKEKAAREGLDRYFGFMVHTHEKEWGRQRRKAWLYMAIAFCFLSAAFLLGDALAGSVFFEVLLEGLFIGGWVFLWNAISTFFIEHTELRQRKRQYRRLLEADKAFFYE